MAARKITLPLTEELAKTLHAGDSVLLTGTIYILTSEENIPESFKEAKKQIKEDIKESHETDDSAENDE